MEIIPTLSHGIVHRARNSLFSYQGWPSICRDENGVLYTVASGMRMRHICPFGKTVLYISRNEGITWTPPIVINDDYLDDRDAGILYLGNGRMLVSWFYHSAVAYQTTYFDFIQKHAHPSEADAILGMLKSYSHVPENFAKGGSFVRLSEDYGVTWSDPIRLPGSAPHGPSLCRDGSLVYLGKDMYITEEENNMNGHIRAYRSTDCGYHWRELSILPIPQGTQNLNFHEPHVIELPDGRLFGAIRAQGDAVEPSFTVFTTESTDGGRTWSPLTNLGIHGSPPHLLLHSSDALIMTVGRRITPFSVRAYISYDFGKNWSDEYILDNRSTNGDMGYPASVEMDDGSIMTVYYQKYQNDPKCSILYTRWSLKDRRSL